MQHHSGRQSCGCHSVCSCLWSNAKKIRVLQEKLQDLDDQREEIETMIQELKAETE